MVDLLRMSRLLVAFQKEIATASVKLTLPGDPSRLAMANAEQEMPCPYVQLAILFQAGGNRHGCTFMFSPEVTSANVHNEAERLVSKCLMTFWELEHRLDERARAVSHDEFFRRLQ